MRGVWSTKEQDKQFVSAFIKDKDGTLRYTIEGKYTEELIATNI